MAGFDANETIAAMPGMLDLAAGGNLRPLVDILEELNARTTKMGSAQKAEAFKKIFGSEASAGMIALAK